MVGENIQTIAKRFDQRLFTAHPSLLDGTFNRGNQQLTKSLQHNRRTPGPSWPSQPACWPRTPLRRKLMSRIAHKHASLGIKPEQYQVVHDELFGHRRCPLRRGGHARGRCRMGRGVLGDGQRTDQPGAGLYSARGVKPQTVWREWALEKKIPQIPDVMTFVFKRIDDRLVKTSLPGQYVTVQMPMPDGVRDARVRSVAPTRADCVDGSTARSRSSGCAAATSRTARCPR